MMRLTNPDAITIIVRRMIANRNKPSTIAGSPDVGCICYSVYLN
jgi:hypothetical protein